MWMRCFNSAQRANSGKSVDFLIHKFIQIGTSATRLVSSMIWCPCPVGLYPAMYVVKYFLTASIFFELTKNVKTPPQQKPLLHCLTHLLIKQHPYYSSLTAELNKSFTQASVNFNTPWSPSGPAT